MPFYKGGKEVRVNHASSNCSYARRESEWCMVEEMCVFVSMCWGKGDGGLCPMLCQIYQCLHNTLLILNIH